jgi:hypothetical protein
MKWAQIVTAEIYIKHMRLISIECFILLFLKSK